MTKICQICGKEFETVQYGAARKYCFECSPSYKDGSRGSIITHLRHSLKNQLVKEKGGKCELCGYSKCFAALEFHHINPEEKEFNIALYCSSNNVNVEKAREDLTKCLLVCANCHREIHNS